MNRPKKNNVMVNPRDLKIFEYLFKNKGGSLKMINKRLFEGSSLSSTSRRLNKLMSIKALERKYFSGKRNMHQSFYVLTPEGATLLQETYPQKITRNYYVSDSIEHDLILSEIMDIVSQFKMVSQVVTESELLSCREYFENPQTRPFWLLRSDRLLVLNLDGEDYYTALEYENSLKSKDRNKKKIRDYYQNNDTPAVFYVCKDAKILKSLMDSDREQMEKGYSKIYFCLLDDVFRSKGKLIFKNVKGKTIVLK